MTATRATLWCFPLSRSRPYRAFIPVRDGIQIQRPAGGWPTGDTIDVDVERELATTPPAVRRLALVLVRQLDGNVARVIADLRPHRDRNRDVARCIDCFEANRERMRHDRYRARGMRIGSGQIGSCRRRMVATRFRRSGCGWSVRGADALPALKTCWKNLRWEQFAIWKAQRIAAA